MHPKCAPIWLGCFLTVLLCACSAGKKLTSSYYYENEKTLTAIESRYKELYRQKPFSLEFTDRSFQFLSLEILTDSIKYIYEFKADEPRLRDTLQRYKINANGVSDLIQKMQSIHCIWVNNLDYYTEDQKRSMVFMSFRPVGKAFPFRKEKYYILTFFSQPQYFDSEGRLLTNRRIKKLRKINEDIFRRINDKVCYTLSERFR